MIKNDSSIPRISIRKINQPDTKSINVKFIHPTAESNIDLLLPLGILLREVFIQLNDTGFLSDFVYQGVIMSSRQCIDSDKSIEENQLVDGDVIQVLISQVGCECDCAVCLANSWVNEVKKVLEGDSLTGQFDEDDIVHHKGFARMQELCEHFIALQQINNTFEILGGESRQNDLDPTDFWKTKQRAYFQLHKTLNNAKYL